MSLTAEAKAALDDVIQKRGYTDYKWIEPHKIITAQWVRMKCMFGCNGYGRCAACPPNTPSLDECERFFNEYDDALVLHFTGTMDKPEDRHNWSAKINAQLVKLEREVFLSGYERFSAFHGLVLFLQGVHRHPGDLPGAADGAPQPGGHGCGCLFHGAPVWLWDQCPHRL